MGIETWLIKVKKSISHTFDSVHVTGTDKKPVIKKSKVGVLAFEIATIMPKLNHLWQNLSDESMARLRNETICIQGVCKVVSTNDALLLSLACAEIVENVKIISKSVSRLSKRCVDSKLRGFETLFDGFANTGRDPYSWILSRKEMEANNKKMEQYVAATATLHKEIDELTVIEKSLKKYTKCDSQSKDHHIHGLQQKLQWQKQKIKFLKNKSLWNKTFDAITSLLARSMFTILSRIKLVFNINHGYPSKCK
ncbi:protein PSK SIMULATOR 1-like [Bidens hawaiensis]|uniref:protein PSK SIMULATOR 1-like n=1 Tax=Bidens hawaiensis TaxID=980011 RepID=UPI0040497661